MVTVTCARRIKATSRELDRRATHEHSPPLKPHRAARAHRALIEHRQPHCNALIVVLGRFQQLRGHPQRVFLQVRQPRGHRVELGVGGLAPLVLVREDLPQVVLGQGVEKEARGPVGGDLEIVGAAHALDRLDLDAVVDEGEVDVGGVELGGQPQALRIREPRIAPALLESVEQAQVEEGLRVDLEWLRG